MDDLDDYESVTRKPLNLSKGKSKIKKKKHIAPAIETNEVLPADSQIVIVTTATKAETAFKSRQGRIAEGRILKKASKSHKQRVEEFNKHLDSLSEHYDIPKVSWTK